MRVDIEEQRLPSTEAFVVQLAAVGDLVVAHDLLEYLSPPLFIEQVLPLPSATVIILFSQEHVE